MLSSSIILNNVTVTLQGNDLLKHVSFEITPKDHLAIIGPSSSGKTTLAKVLAGQLFAKGSVEINYDINSPLLHKVQLIEQRYQFKNLSNVSDFYYQQRFNSFDAADALTIMQELQQVAAHHPEAQAKMEDWLQQLGMYHRKDAPIIQLSSGEHKRFQLIKGLLAPPQILILDTPFVGLDKGARRKLHHIINSIADNGTQVIIITDAHEVPDCITHVAYLEEGELKAFELKKDFDFSSVIHHQHQFNLNELPITGNESEFKDVLIMKNATVSYGSKTILYNINWQVKRAEKWLLRGHNGAGKSTLLSLINGDNPQAYKNEIYLFDKRRGSGESIWDIKQKIGYVSPELHAFFDKGTTCYNAVASGFFDTIGLFKKLTAQQQILVQQWLDFLQLSSVQAKLLSTLSSGTQRLVLLARALVKNPPLLILDEPCQGLDDDQKDSFVHLVNDLCERLDKTLIYVSHYENEIPPCIDHVLELNMGKQKVYSVERHTEEIIQL
jgi:molybdate transport system ATP-binding protein